MKCRHGRGHEQSYCREFEYDDKSRRHYDHDCAQRDYGIGMVPVRRAVGPWVEGAKPLSGGSGQRISPALERANRQVDLLNGNFGNKYFLKQFWIIPFPSRRAIAT